MAGLVKRVKKAVKAFFDTVRQTASELVGRFRGEEVAAAVVAVTEPVVEVVAEGPPDVVAEGTGEVAVGVQVVPVAEPVVEVVAQALPAVVADEAACEVSGAVQVVPPAAVVVAVVAAVPGRVAAGAVAVPAEARPLVCHGVPQEVERGVACGRALRPRRSLRPPDRYGDYVMY